MRDLTGMCVHVCYMFCRFRYSKKWIFFFKTEADAQQAVVRFSQLHHSFRPYRWWLLWELSAAK